MIIINKLLDIRLSIQCEGRSRRVLSATVDNTLQICLILYIIELLNPISVLLSFQNIPDLTACSDQCQVPEFFCLFLGNFRIERDVKSKRYSSNSSCHRSCIIFANLAFF